MMSKAEQPQDRSYRWWHKRNPQQSTWLWNDLGSKAAPQVSSLTLSTQLTDGTRSEWNQLPAYERWLPTTKWNAIGPAHFYGREFGEHTLKAPSDNISSSWNKTHGSIQNVSGRNLRDGHFGAAKNMHLRHSGDCAGSTAPWLPMQMRPDLGWVKKRISVDIFVPNNRITWLIGAEGPAMRSSTLAPSPEAVLWKCSVPGPGSTRLKRVQGIAHHLAFERYYLGSEAVRPASHSIIYEHLQTEQQQKS